MNRISDRSEGEAVATVSASNTPKTRSRHSSPETVRYEGREANSSGGAETDLAFARTIREELAPSTLLEEILAERVIISARRLHEGTVAEAAGVEGATSDRRALILAE